MQNAEVSILNYIKEKYNPIAIVLHGSRANGMAREHSDWDILLLANSGSKPHRELIEGANVEYTQITLPATNKALNFAYRSENTKVLYDPEGIAASFIASVDEYIAKGNQFEEVNVRARKAFLLSSLNGIEDYADTPLILFDKKVDFYTRIVMSWFQFLRNEFEPSHYFAFPRIKKEDPEFYSLIEQFVASSDAAELVLIGTNIINRLFPERD